MTRQFFLHIGAHRTGSTSFQLCLDANRETLVRNSFIPAYPSRDGIRDGLLAMRLPMPRHSPEDTKKMISNLNAHLTTDIAVDPCGRVILSEENILGGMAHFTNALFYPAAERRCGALLAAFEQPPEHVVLVVRNYSAFYRSCFRKRAEEIHVTPFRDQVPFFLAMDRGWPELVQAILDYLSPRSLTVMTYEERGESRRLLKTLVPELSDAGLIEPRLAMNTSATDSALLALQEVYANGRRLSRKKRREIIQNHAQNHADLGLSRFTEAETTALKIRYDRDLDKLQSMSGIVFI